MTPTRRNPTILDALKVARDLNDEPGANPEYERGQLELIVDLFGVDEGMDARGRIATILGWPDRY